MSENLFFHKIIYNSKWKSFYFLKREPKVEYQIYDDLSYLKEADFKYIFELFLFNSL